MGRLLGAAAVAVAIAAGPAIGVEPAIAAGPAIAVGPAAAGAAGTGVAGTGTAWARPTDATGGGKSTPTSAPRRTTAAICQDTAKIVVLGLQMFVGQMERVSAQARAGDLVGSDLAVRDAGAGLAVVAGQLRRDAVDAEDTNLRKAINDMASEFERLGAALPGLTALPAFDAGALDAMATRMGVICGPTPKPTAPVLPTQTARGLPAPSPAGG